MQIDTTVMSEYDILSYIPWLDKVVFGNSLHAYILTVLAFVVIWAALYVIRRYISHRLQRPADEKATEARQVVTDLIYSIRPWVFPLVAFFISSQRLTLSPSLDKFIRLATMAAVMLVVVRILSELIAFLITRTRLSGRNDDAVVKSTNQNITTLVKIAVWTAGIMFFLDNAGFNVGTFVAGLGIGGIAIALAAQALLGDAFSSFAIAMDKPFEVGDIIVVDDLTGTVEHIGLKTTRVRSAGGELLILANSDLTKSRIRNFKKMYRRRIQFKLELVYQTPVDKLRKIPSLLEEIIKSEKNVQTDTQHFSAFGHSGLIFEIVYYVLAPEANKPNDIQQSINLKIHEAFTKEGIQLAYPTRTVFMAKE